MKRRKKNTEKKFITLEKMDRGCNLYGVSFWVFLRLLLCCICCFFKVSVGEQK